MKRDCLRNIVIVGGGGTVGWVAVAESMPLHADYISKQKYNIFQSTKTAATAN